MAEGLLAGVFSFEISAARHAKDALQQRGLTMLDLVGALRAAPGKSRRGRRSGHYVGRDGDSRFVFENDPSATKSDCDRRRRAWGLSARVNVQKLEAE